MSARVLADLIAEGYTVQITATGGLRCTHASGWIPPRVVDFLRNHKTEIIAELTRPADHPALDDDDRAWLADHPDAAAIVAAFAEAHDEGLLIQRGIAPPGWIVPAECQHCGPVLLAYHLDHPALGCPWCFVRLAGLSVPRPLVDIQATQPRQD